MTSPGWYDDPHVPGQQRYWDGAVWTDQVAPAGTRGPGGPWVVVLVVVAALVVGVGAFLATRAVLDEDEDEGVAATASTSTSVAETTTTVAETVPTTAADPDRPLAEPGFYVIFASESLDSPSAPDPVGRMEAAAAAVDGAVVVFTDDYLTLPRDDPDAGDPPDFLPAEGAVAAAVGPFADAGEAQEACDDDFGGDCLLRQLLPPGE